MQMKIDPAAKRPPADEASRAEPMRTDRHLTGGDDSDVGLSNPPADEEQVVLGPQKARAGSGNRTNARALVFGMILVVVGFAVGYWMLG